MVVFNVKRLTSTGWGPVILDDVGVVTGLVWTLGDAIFLKPLDRCWTVSSTWDEAKVQNKNCLSNETL